MLKENCHFYTEYENMGSHIPCCNRYTQIGKCPCNDCNYFLDEIDAQKIIKKYLDKELIPITQVDKIRAEIEQLPTKTRTNWDGCCPDIDYPESER